ncbi:MAG: NAD(+)/NADH kinase, partial [Pseudomonadota bacterium]
MRLHFTANGSDEATQAQARLIDRYGQVARAEADAIVALGGDGFMLATLHATERLSAPVYGMNRGTVGF